jgi:aminomethyltransferase
MTMPESPLAKTQRQLGAEMTSLADWTVAANFGDLDAEIDAIQNRAAVYDLSHLGRLRVRGDDALALLETCCGEDVARLEDDTVTPLPIRNAAGDELAIICLSRLDGMWLVTTPAGQRETILTALQEANDAAGLSAKVDDQTLKTTHLAVAGPAARELLDGLLPEAPSQLARGQARMGTLMIAKYIALRTGRLPQWSLEVIIPNMMASPAWGFITTKAGKGEKTLPPVGTQAVDALANT